MNFFTDQSNRTIKTGKVIGRGGEGSVFEVIGDRNLVAKIYHQPLSVERAAKIEAMTSIATSNITRVCAWPTSLLKNGRQAVGLLMPHVAARKEIHLLTGPKSRKAEFPDAGFAFLVHVATNVARAVAELHNAGVVLGDVNDRGVMVGKDATVRLIDCDSFQVTTPNHVFLCDVGVPGFTPPELQGQNLRNVRRTAQHDAFGLAVLIFQLLFMGRHPFAGRYQHGNLELEEAIKQNRYAYSRDPGRIGMRPPPNTMGIVDGSGTTVADYFERAFLPGHIRPKASEWVDALETLQGKLTTCQWNRAHSYVSGQASCPWCELEHRSGVDLFNFVATATDQCPAIDIETIWQAVNVLSVQMVPTPVSLSSIVGLTGTPVPDAITSGTKKYIDLKAEEVRTRTVANLAKSKSQQWVQKISSIEAAVTASHPELKPLEVQITLRVRPLHSKYRLLSGAIIAAIVLIVALSMILGSSQIGQASGIIFAVAVSFGGAWILDRRERASAGSLMNELQMRRTQIIERESSINVEMQAARNGFAVEYQISRDKGELADAIGQTAQRVKYETERLIEGVREYRTRKTVAAKQAVDRAVQTLKVLEQERNALNGELVARKQQMQLAVTEWRDLGRKREDDLKRLRDDDRRVQLEEYLDKCLIFQANINGITHALKSKLLSHGIETAADITEANVLKVQGFGKVRTARMVDWRHAIERRFQYQPGKPLDPARLKAIESRYTNDRRRIERDISVAGADLRRRIGTLKERIDVAKYLADNHVRELAQAQADANISYAINLPD